MLALFTTSGAHGAVRVPWELNRVATNVHILIDRLLCHVLIVRNAQDERAVFVADCCHDVVVSQHGSQRGIVWAVNY